MQRQPIRRTPVHRAPHWPLHVQILRAHVVQRLGRLDPQAAEPHAWRGQGDADPVAAAKSGAAIQRHHGPEGREESFPWLTSLTKNSVAGNFGEAT